MNIPGSFCGIGVGPGPEGFIPLAAWQALKQADIVFLPKASSADKSIALECLRGLDLADGRLKEIEYAMDDTKSSLGQRYSELALVIESELRQGRNVAYLTIGDSLTYSTYSYLLEALLSLMPDVPHRTFPGITSYAAAAAALDWPVGQGKERVLILPCPDRPEDLRLEIESHDIVVLMKVGHRLSMVLHLLKQMGIAEHCALASRIGLPGQVLEKNLCELPPQAALGYLTTILIRKPEGRGTEA